MTLETRLAGLAELQSHARCLVDNLAEDANAMGVHDTPTPDEASAWAAIDKAREDAVDIVAALEVVAASLNFAAECLKDSR